MGTMLPHIHINQTNQHKHSHLSACSTQKKVILGQATHWQ